MAIMALKTESSDFQLRKTADAYVQRAMCLLSYYYDLLFGIIAFRIGAFVIVAFGIAAFGIATCTQVEHIHMTH